MLNREAYIQLHEKNKRYLKNLGPNLLKIGNGIRLIDKYKENLLIEYAITDERSRTTYRYIRVQDSSTGEHVFLSVPNTINECKDAIAWTFNLKPKEFELLFET